MRGPGWENALHDRLRLLACRLGGHQRRFERGPRHGCDRAGDIAGGSHAADQHGVTSHLTTQEIEQLALFVNSIGFPASPGPAVGAPVVASAGSAATVRACPNPFRAETSLRFTLDAPARDVRVDVYDVAGRHVRNLWSRALPRGTHVVGWDGTNAERQAVAAGTYFVRWSVDGAARPPSRMTVLR